MMKRKQTEYELAWLWPFFKPYRWTLLVVFILAIASTALQLSYPYLSKIFIDDVLIEPTYSLERILLVTFSLSVLAIVTQLVNSYIYLRVTLQMIKSLRLHLFHHIERLHHQFFVRTPIGEITTRLSGDINIVHGTLTDGVLQLCMTMLTLIFITTMLIILNVKLFLLTLFIFPFLIATLVYFRPLITSKTKQLREDQSAIQGHMIETFTRIRLVKLLTAENERRDQLSGKIDTLNKHSLQYAIIESVAGGIPQALTIGMTTIILLFGGRMVLDDTMTVGSLLAFTAYLSRFFSPVQTLAGLYIRFQNMNVSLQRLTDYLKLPVEDGRATCQLHRSDLDETATLVFEDVTKRHEHRTLFEHVHLTLQPRTAYAVVGPSGVGKSTFVDLIVRIQDATEGKIQLANKRVETIGVQSLRDTVCVVPQDVEILNETIRDNLLFGQSNEEKRQVSDQRLEEVCRTIGLHDDFCRLPNGYDTFVGEAGKRLSGGQRQRLAIARALLRNPRILILDEATSGSDYELERELFGHLRTWLNERDDRWLFVISHRLESLATFDEWLIFRNGTIERLNDYEQMRRQISEREGRASHVDDRTEGSEPV